MHVVFVPERAFACDLDARDVVIGAGPLNRDDAGLGLFVDRSSADLSCLSFQSRVHTGAKRCTQVPHQG